MTEPIDFLNRAAELAPVPDRSDADPKLWVRHYAAQAMAAHAAFRLVERIDPGPNLGYLALLGTAATAVVVAIMEPAEVVSHALWDVTPEAGDLNGNWIGFLADTLEAHNINPADLYPWFEAKDFTSPVRLPRIEVAP